MGKRMILLVSILAVALTPGLLEAQAKSPDFDGNGKVDFDDFFLFADVFGTQLGDAKFNAKFDLDNSGAVNFEDFFQFAANFGKTITPVFPQLISADTLATPEQFEVIQVKTTDSSGKATLRSETMKKDIQITITGKDGQSVPNLQVKTLVFQDKLLMFISDETGIYQPTLVEGTPLTQSSSVLQGGGASKPSHTLQVTVIGTVIIVAVVVYTLKEAFDDGRQLTEALVEMKDFHLDNFREVSLNSVVYKASIKEVANLMNSMNKGFFAFIFIGLSFAGSKIPGLKTAVRKVYNWAIKELAGQSALMTVENISRMLTATYGDQIKNKLGPDTEVYLIGHFLHDSAKPFKIAFEILLAEDESGEMVLVPAGAFTMGDSRIGEVPEHKVTLSAFYIDKYEVTNAQYQAFVKATNRAHPPSDSRFNGPSQPVVWVTWFDAQAYCTWAKKRLPTEAEWEKAARGTDGRKYPWGNEAPDAGGVYRADYYAGSSGGADGFEYTAPVGSYPKGASPYGAQDMAGNVWEWVSSKYRSYPYSATDDREDIDNTSDSRVLRGDSWLLDPRFVRAANRTRYDPPIWNTYIGFRCSKTP